MSDLFGVPPPAAPAPKPARRKAAGAAQTGRPAAELQVMQVMQVVQAEPPAPTPRVEEINIPGRGRLVTLHDGRQVDSWSMDWVWECLANTLLQLSPGDRGEWLAGYADVHGQPAEQDLRRLVRAVAKAREGDNPRRR